MRVFNIGTEQKRINTILSTANVRKYLEAALPPTFQAQLAILTIRGAGWLSTWAHTRLQGGPGTDPWVGWRKKGLGKSSQTGVISTASVFSGLNSDLPPFAYLFVYLDCTAELKGAFTVWLREDAQLLASASRTARGLRSLWPQIGRKAVTSFFFFF